jgi:SAM-dependent methyltransferase
MLKPSLKNTIRWFLMPGFDLFTRRRVRLCRHWSRGARRVLDAGSGNGWFSYLAYRSGATVTAVNFAKDQVEKAERFYNDWAGIGKDRLRFQQLNLYDLLTLGEQYDEIICYETLEHIKDDGAVCSSFWKLLKPGGLLHLCCPFAEHPRWRNETLDLEEKGYHVRAGYTLASYRSLLEPIGFQIVEAEGIGGRALTGVSRFVSIARNRCGDALCAPLALISLPLVGFDQGDSDCPYSLYVKALKPASAE